jgi:phage tail-like protein
MPQPAAPTATMARLTRPGGPTVIFREVSGLDSEQEVTEQREVDPEGNPVIVRVPGAARWSNVVLTRAITSGTELRDWRKQVLRGQIERARDDATIELFAFDGTPVAGYRLRRAWPAGYSVSQAAGEVAIESITLVHEGFE